MINGIILEICAGSIRDIETIIAFKEIDRIELNNSMELGGLTPSPGTLLTARKLTSLPIICMVRPRPAGFVYNPREKETMLADARWLLENGANGIAFGCLTEENTVDEPFAKAMVDICHGYGKEAVFHMAFDQARDCDEATVSLIQCHVDRILLKGCAESAQQGIPAISRLQKTYGDQIAFLPGGGVTSANIRHIVTKTWCSQIHMSAKATLHDAADYYAVSSANIRRAIMALSDARQRVFTREDASMLMEANK